MLNRIAFSVERIAYSKKRNIFLSSLPAKKGRAPLQTITQSLIRKKFVTGFTLIELLIAITLVGMILLTICAVDLASRRFLNTSDLESRVQNEVAPILEMIAKDITRGYGNDNNPGLILGSTEVQIRGLDAASPPTYDIFTDDPWVRYTFNGAPNYNITREYCSSSGVFQCGSWSGSTETLVNNILGCSFIIGTDNLLNQNLYVTIAITARRDANSGESPTNPQVILNTTVAARSQSIH